MYGFLTLLIRHRRMSHGNEKDSMLTGLAFYKKEKKKKKVPKTKSYIDFF